MASVGAGSGGPNAPKARKAGKDPTAPRPRPDFFYRYTLFLGGGGGPSPSAPATHTAQIPPEMNSAEISAENLPTLKAASWYLYFYKFFDSRASQKFLNFRA